VTNSSRWTFDTSPQACIARLEISAAHRLEFIAPETRLWLDALLDNTDLLLLRCLVDPDFYRAVRLAVAAAASDFQAAYALEDRAEIVYQRLRVRGDEWAFNC
jgi:hypothetical protein